MPTVSPMRSARRDGFPDTEGSLTACNATLRLIWALVIACGVLSSTANAVGPSEESELIALGKAWIDAEVSHDKAALERILDERFVVTYSSGKTLDRAAFVERIMNAEVKPFEVVNEVVNVHGDVGLVIDTTADHTVKFTWVAVRKEGQWRVISETFSRIAPPK